MVFESGGGDFENPLDNADVLQVPLQIGIPRRRPLTTRMWENLFREMNEAALVTDLRLYEQATRFDFAFERGREILVRQKNRFVVTSVERGSIEIVGGILLAAGWAFKKFVEPGWEKSASKKTWDDAVAGMIDKAVPVLKEQIDYRIVHKLKQIKISRVSLRPISSDNNLRLSDKTAPDAELIYDKAKQIAHQPRRKAT